MVTPEDIASGRLSRGGFDVLMVPGGKSRRYLELLTPAGCQEVKEFLSRGGGYVGICAGAYLGCQGMLNILPVAVLDGDHWNRGRTDACDVCLSRELQGAFSQLGADGLPDQLSVPYRNGPLFRLLELAGAASVIPVMLFESEMRGECGTYPASMRGTPAVVAGFHGHGRAVLVSPHIEDCLEHGHILQALVHWACGDKVERGSRNGTGLATQKAEPSKMILSIAHAMVTELGRQSGDTLCKRGSLKGTAVPAQKTLARRSSGRNSKISLTIAGAMLTELVAAHGEAPHKTPLQPCYGSVTSVV